MCKPLSRFRLEAFRRQAGRCYYWSAPMWFENASAFARMHGITDRAARMLQCTAEHLQARRDGGKDSTANIVAACRYCNKRRHWRRKSVLSPAAYMRLVRLRLKKGRWHCHQIMARRLATVDQDPPLEAA